MFTVYSGLSRAIRDDIIGLQDRVREVSKGIAGLRVGQERREPGPLAYLLVRVVIDMFD